MVAKGGVRDYIAFSICMQQLLKDICCCWLALSSKHNIHGKYYFKGEEEIFDFLKINTPNNFYIVRGEGCPSRPKRNTDIANIQLIV